MTVAVGGVGEGELLEQLVGAPPRLGSRGAGTAGRTADQVLPAGQVLVDGRVLAGQADDRAQLLGLAHDVEAADGGAPGVGPQQGGEDAHRRRLAGAVRAEQPEDAALGDGQVEPVERAHLALPRAVDLDQAFGDDGVRNNRTSGRGVGHHFMIHRIAIHRMTQKAIFVDSDRARDLDQVAAGVVEHRGHHRTHLGGLLGEADAAA